MALFIGIHLGICLADQKIEVQSIIDDVFGDPYAGHDLERKRFALRIILKMVMDTGSNVIPFRSYPPVARHGTDELIASKSCAYSLLTHYGCDRPGNTSYSIVSYVVTVLVVDELEIIKIY